MVSSKRPASQHVLRELLRRAGWVQEARHTPPLSAWLERQLTGHDGRAD
jgi:hypothetical protein